jgi:hypothetical protein
MIATAPLAWTETDALHELAQARSEVYRFWGAGQANTHAIHLDERGTFSSHSGRALRDV